jgi:molybdopterin-guanine dinucleotide biosynthesis protein A
MPISAVDHLEAALARIRREDIAALPPARRERLKAQLGEWECLCDELVQPKPTAGVLAALRAGQRME